MEQRIDDLIQMSKAAHHQAIRRDDFMRTMGAVESKRHGAAGGGALALPNLPSLQDTGDDDDDTETGGGEAAVRLHPVDIGALKEMMWRKVQKITVVNSGKREKLNSGGGAGGGGMSSRQSSKVSIKSSDSGTRLK